MGMHQLDFFDAPKSQASEPRRRLLYQVLPIRLVGGPLWERSGPIPRESGKLHDDE